MDYTTNTQLKGILLNPNFLKKLEHLCLQARKLLKHRSRFMVKYWQNNRGFEFSDYRSYVSGDDLRQVDWNIYSRLGELVVKEYEVEPPRHLVIALDISPSMELHQKFVYGVKLAASLIYMGLSLLDKVTFFVYPQTTPLKITTHSGKRYIRPIFQYLENLQIQNIGNQQETFCKARLFLPQHASTVIIGDLYDREGLNALPLLHLSGHMCLAIQIVSSQEHNPNITGTVILKDIETQKTKLVSANSPQIALYQQQFQKYLSQVKSFCLSKKIGHILVNPQEEEKLLLSLLRYLGILK